MGQCPLAFTMTDGQAREAEIYLHHRDGHRVPVFVRSSPLKTPEGTIMGGAELFTDISSADAIELRLKELEEMALLDGLTHLANRRYMERELATRFAEHGRMGILFGILFMDIDHFKKFNDTYGHDVGDKVIKYVADTLTKNSRPFDLVGRWGGEEFVAIIRNVSSRQLEQLGERMRVLVENSYLSVGGNRLSVTISIGATLIGDNDTAETVVKRADTLLYESKRQGRNRLTLG
jgi:diguanylate cyclase (GGDEF)-like protein